MYTWLDEFRICSLFDSPMLHGEKENLKIFVMGWYAVMLSELSIV